MMAIKRESASSTGSSSMHTPEVTSASTTATRRTSEDCIQISSIPVRGAPAHQATTPAAASSPQTASLDHHHGLEVIAFSSGSTPALSPQERQRSVANHRESTSSTASNPQDLSSGSLSPWKEFLKRRQAAAAASATAGGTGDIATKTGKSVAPAAITDAETILASLLLPSARKNSRDTVAEERLYIAARNKVHRPRARKRTSSSGARVEGVVTPITAKASTKTRRSSEVPVSFASTPASMASSHYGGVPSGSSSGNNNAQRNHLSSRDYGYSTSNKHSNNSPSTGGMSDYTPPQSASTGTTGSSNLSSPFSPSSSYTTTGQNRPPIGASSKASQMLGLSSSHRSPDMYMSQTTTYHSAHSDGASTLNGNSTGIRHPHYHQDQHSPTTSTGSGGKIVNAPQSHSRMTLKKARSLFSSGGGKNNSKDKSSGSSTPEAGLPSPSITGSMMNVRPMGMGSYGDAYPSVPPAVVGSSSYSNIQSTLLHSKSHGSLQGAMTGSMRPSNPPLPPSHLEDSYHPYAASSRKASHPILPSHSGAKSAAAREAEQDIACPVCLESLSIRLQGEKPHVLPICGHKLHNECFETAYNITVAQALQDSDPRAEGVRRKKRNPIGICGICRSEMRVGDPSEIGKNKFALLSGQPGRSGAPALDTHKIHSISKRTIGSDEHDGPTSASLHDPAEDQDVLNPHQLLPAYMQHLALGPARSSPFTAGALERVMPKISVRAEHTSLARVSDPEKRVHLTCLVTVEIPSRVPGLDMRAQYQTAGERIPASSSQKSLPHIHSAQNSQSTILGYQPGNLDSSSRDRERSVSNPGTSITASSSLNHHPSPDTQGNQVFRRESNATAHTHGTEDFPTSPSVSTFSGAGHLSGHHHPASSGMEKSMSNMTISSSGHGHDMSQTPATTASAGFTPHSTSASSFHEHQHNSPGRYDDATGGTGYNPSMNASAITLTTTTTNAAAEEEKTREAHGPFADVFKDLQDRMSDWKGHEPSTFGSLRTYDSLAVKKDKNVREFVVYLFEEALLCVVDDARKAAVGSTVTSSQTQLGTAEEGKLRLKGRVFVKHMKQVEDTSSVDGGLSLTIHMEDDSLESFVILFPHREVLEVWRSQIQALIDHHRPPLPNSNTKTSLATSGSRRDSVFSNETNRSTQSSFSRNTKATTATSISNAGSGPVPSGAIPPVPTLKKSLASLSNAVLDWTPPDPATFVPIDLMLVLSVPRANSSNGPSSNGLKLRLIKSTLDFIIHAVGPRARISIVAYSTGDSTTSSLRKTPWLATGRSDGMSRLEQAVAELAGEHSARHDDGLVTVDPKEEKVTVASAVNLALDIMLQRTSKSTTSGMIVLNDSKDGAQKQQIDLVLARTDAGGVPIHTFGWGRSHDPSSLWLLSNHTKGTYTFVRDFYQLREAMAGCIGGMLCVAVHSLHLHLNVQERRWFKIRKVAGVASAIVSSDGKDVDITLGELRYGEKKEMLVEIEMASPKHEASRTASAHTRISSKEQTVSRKKSMTATDDFFLKKVGMDPLSLGGDDDLGSSDFFDEVEDGMADDVPVFDVNASFKNPQDPTGEVCKLPYPSLLTITVTPPAKSSNNAPDSPASTSTTSTVSDPTIVRRRMELLTSDMITRTLLLMSRRQDSGAQRLLVETTRIFSAIIGNLIPPSMNENAVSVETRYANEVLQACLDDIEQLKSGCDDRVEFDSATRNFGAQQAVALRDQRAWTGRTATEALFFCREWTAIFGRALTNPV